MAKILLVDDDPDFLEMLRLLLEQREGHQVTLCADGADGLAKALADPPDLAILDVMMPEMTGYEICRRLRNDPSTASIPIIILTARGQPIDRQAALDAGADDHMPKPVTMAELSERVGTLLKTGKRPSLQGGLAFLSLRGGVGVTTLAVNLAALLAQTGDGGACLVDLCPSSGHAALQLGLRPDPNWVDLLQAGSPDPAALETHLLQHQSGLRLMASPIFPVVKHNLSQAFTRELLKSVQQRFAAIIMDTPSVLNEATLAALEIATVVAMVVTAESPSIQTAIGTLRTLNQWASKFRVILNQVAPGPQLPAEAIERALKRPVVGNIPFDPSQAQALAQGAPLTLTNPSSPLAQAVRKAAQELTRT